MLTTSLAPPRRPPHHLGLFPISHGELAEGDQLSDPGEAGLAPTSRVTVNDLLLLRHDPLLP